MNKAQTKKLADAKTQLSRRIKLRDYAIEALKTAPETSQQLHKDSIKNHEEAIVLVQEEIKILEALYKSTQK